MAIRNVEVEVRALISLSDFRRLKKFFSEKARFVNRHHDETFYFDKEGCLRLRREKKFDYVIYKYGKIHDPGRKEIEIKLDKRDFSKIREIFGLLGFPLVVGWKRERFKWIWRGFQAYLDNTSGYGRIFEMEAMVSGKDKDKARKKILELFKELDIKPTPEKKIKKHYDNYIKKWKK